MRYFVAIAALAATTALATPASAAPASATIRADALLIQPATLQRVDDLSFGTIIATPSASGDVSIDADTGARTLATGLTGSTTDVGQRGRFIGNGYVNQNVPLTVSFPTYLSNQADPTKTVEFSGKLDADAEADKSVNTGATGVFYVGVGGTITVDQNQMPGLYRGEVTLTAQFQ